MIHIPHLSTIAYMSPQELHALRAAILTALNTGTTPQEQNHMLLLLHRINATLNRKPPSSRP